MITLKPPLRLDEVTVGSDGTVMGCDLDEGTRFVKPLDLLWIEAVWFTVPQSRQATMWLSAFADAHGGPAVYPPDGDYLPRIRVSSYAARVKMLRIARKEIADEVMAGYLGIEVATLRDVLAFAYGV